VKPAALGKAQIVPSIPGLAYSRSIVPGWESKRTYASSSEPDLKETLKNVIPAKRELLKKVKSHADKKLGEVKVENTLGGMRCALPTSTLSARAYK